VETGGELKRWFPNPEDDSFVPHFGTITNLRFDPSGRYLASAGLDNTAKVWDAVSLTQVADMRDFLGRVEVLEWSPDGTRLAVGGEDGVGLRHWPGIGRSRTVVLKNSRR